MSLNTIDYLNLSALAYIDFKDNAKDNDIAYILKNGLYTGDVDKNSPELSALQSPSNPLRSWKVIAQSASSSTHTVIQRGHTRQVTTEVSFSATAFQNPETGEIVFAFRGSDDIGDWVGAVSRQFVY